MTLPRANLRRLLSATAGMTAVLLVAAGLSAAEHAPAAAAAAPSASEQLTPDAGLLFGAFVGPAKGQSFEEATADLESRIGRKFDLQRWYATWDGNLATPSITTAVTRGRTLVLSIEPTLDDGTIIPWASIADGDHDAEIAQQAAAVKAISAPLFLIFHHEPDYAADHGTPAEYRAAYRHYVAEFRAAGVTNVAWAWVLTPAAFSSPPTSPGKVSADDLYPGDDYVDWVGLDPYNWYGCAAGVPGTWRTMAEIAGPFHEWGVRHGKPQMFAEWGSVEDPADPERRANWYRRTLTTLAGWPEVKAIVAFDTQGTCDWHVDNTASSLAGFRDAGARSWAHGRANGYLTASRTIGAAPLSVAFNASLSTGTSNRNGAGVTSWSLDFGDGTAQRGTGQPPTSINHTYSSGVFEANLSVTDATGSTSVDRRTITAAAAPTMTGSERDRTDTSIGLYTWVNPQGLSARVQIEWGTTTAYGNSSQVIAVDPVSYAKQLSVTASGLTPGTRYYWRVTATSAAGTTVMTRTTDTLGPPTSSWTSVSGRTGSKATVSVGVDPHGAAAKVWLEWGPTRSLGRTTAAVSLDAIGYEKTLRFALSGMSPRTTYYYRVVATNTYGTLTGTTSSFVTLTGS